jgi:hypothetical protein
VNLAKHISGKLHPWLFQRGAAPDNYRAGLGAAKWANRLATTTATSRVPELRRRHEIRNPYIPVRCPFGIEELRKQAPKKHNE